MYRDNIVKISKQFTKGLGIPINGSGWVVVEPLSAYLNALGYHNNILEIPREKNGGKQVLVIEFKDGSHLIPDAKSLKGFEKLKNWTWVD